MIPKNINNFKAQINRDTMGNKVSKNTVLNKIDEDNVKFVRLQFVDINGTIKSIKITSNELKEAFKEGIMFDGSSIEGFVRVYESDMVLKPDPNTFEIYPWDKDVGRIICDVYESDGETRFKGDPRYVLKKNLEELKKLGDYEFHVGPELEYYLYKETEEGFLENQDDESYFDFTPNNLAQKVRKDIAEAMINMNIDFESSHHEVGASQNEVDFRFSDALETADSILTTKAITKFKARQNDLLATFMPKPFEEEMGNGMHLHINISSGNNLFSGNEKLGLSEKGLNFVGGLLKHSKAITAITNPTVNSYKRMVPGYEAPVYITWGRKNRSTLIRIPTSEEKARRIEYRSPDPSANPYLAFASILAAGLDGIKNNYRPPKPVLQNVYDLDPEEREQKNIEILPNTLKESIQALKSDQVIKNSLYGAYDEFIKHKETEWKKYRVNVSDWERERYLDI